MLSNGMTWHFLWHTEHIEDVFGVQMALKGEQMKGGSGSMVVTQCLGGGDGGNGGNVLLVNFDCSFIHIAFNGSFN